MKSPSKAMVRRKQIRWLADMFHFAADPDFKKIKITKMHDGLIFKTGEMSQWSDEIPGVIEMQNKKFRIRIEEIE